MSARKLLTLFMLLALLSGCANPKPGECYASRKAIYKVVKVGQFSVKAKIVSMDEEAFRLIPIRAFSTVLDKCDCPEIFR